LSCRTRSRRNLRQTMPGDKKKGKIMSKRKQSHDNGFSREKKRKHKKTVAENDRPQHPFEADELDHCETPLEAYEDISLLLALVAKSLGKSRRTLSIYDPYYCNGAVKKRLGSFGFENIYNKCEDFYNSTAGPKDFDVLLTNPPYSGNHMEKLFEFCSDKKKPFFLLLPHYVYTKPYFNLIRSVSKDDASGSRTFFMIPGMGRRYTYLPPKWAAGHDKTTTSPFPSFWYCNCYELNETILTALQESLQANASDPLGEKKSRYAHFRQKVVLCLNASDLPNELKGEFDKSKKRPSPKQRKKLAKRRAQLRLMT